MCIRDRMKGMMGATIPISVKKKVYYISAEFLIGKLLSNNMINLGIYDKVDSILKMCIRDRPEAAAIPLSLCS